MRWPKGATQGSVIAGGNGLGEQSNQLNYTLGLSFDRDNFRVQLSIVFFFVCCSVPMTVRPIVICGPSGVGKGTLLKWLFAEFPDDFAFAVSHTTRKPREGEIHGKSYFFTDRESMMKDIEAGKFIETAEFAGNLYGTSVATLENLATQGKICFLEIDTQGAKRLRNFAGSVEKISSLNARFLFVRPVSHEVLERQLRSRGTESDEKIQERLDLAKLEVEFLENNPDFFEKVLVIDNFEAAYSELKAYISTFYQLH
ncbi:unnamed protein product [Adineta ricciae]|uniref:guanylate kinase n=1 Tax=Adineta ricciae TaxID=249248 RepID=A0A815VK92_ADIRI|nr:unnamed protein product [Adineta ricciae]